MDINYTIMEQNNTNNQNIPVIINVNNDQNQYLNTPLFQNETNSMNQINYNINKINDKHINNYGYFYIDSNPFFELINQEKIKIKHQTSATNISGCTGFCWCICFIGIILMIVSNIAFFFVPLIGFIGLVISIKYNNAHGPGYDNYICFNKTNSDIEVNYFKNLKKINLPLNSIVRIIMEYTNENSVFYFINNLNEKMQFLKLPLQNGVPFKEGEDILNDWFNYLKSKEENNKV